MLQDAMNFMLSFEMLSGRPEWQEVEAARSVARARTEALKQDYVQHQQPLRQVSIVPVVVQSFTDAFNCNTYLSCQRCTC